MEKKMENLSKVYTLSHDGAIFGWNYDKNDELESSETPEQNREIDDEGYYDEGSIIQTHVDVKYGGKWILGTTDTYLSLICTLFTDKDGKTKTGFSGRIENKIPASRLLKLTPVDSHTAGEHNKFHGGRFSGVTESGKKERHLVATVGKFSIIWDFQQMKNSAHEC